VHAQLSKADQKTPFFSFILLGIILVFQSFRSLLKYLANKRVALLIKVSKVCFFDAGKSAQEEKQELNIQNFLMMQFGKLTTDSESA
jgi:hypothetical protein